MYDEPLTAAFFDENGNRKPEYFNPDGSRNQENPPTSRFLRMQVVPSNTLQTAGLVELITADAKVVENNTNYPDDSTQLKLRDRLEFLLNTTLREEGLRFNEIRIPIDFFNTLLSDQEHAFDPDPSALRKALQPFGVNFLYLNQKTKPRFEIDSQGNYFNLGFDYNVCGFDNPFLVCVPPGSSYGL